MTTGPSIDPAQLRVPRGSGSAADVDVDAASTTTSTTRRRWAGAFLVAGHGGHATTARALACGYRCSCSRCIRCWITGWSGPRWSDSARAAAAVGEQIRAFDGAVTAVDAITALAQG